MAEEAEAVASDRAELADPAADEAAELAEPAAEEAAPPAPPKMVVEPMVEVTADPSVV